MTRIEQFREEMQKEGMDLYLIPSEDFHMSEYVGEHFRAIRYLSGFTGEGNLVVGKNGAWLFTDGRYFEQAEEEMKGSGVSLCRMGEPGVPSLFDFLTENTPAGGRLGFDGRAVSGRFGTKLSLELQKKQATLSCSLDLIDRVWTDRPGFPATRVWILEDRFAGKNALTKLQELRGYMQEREADYHLISTLDDIAWLLNLRASDIPCNPVFLSHLLLEKTRGYLFACPEAFDERAKQYLSDLGITLCPYDAITEMLQSLSEGRLLWESGKTSYAMMAALPASVSTIDEMLPTSLWKSRKNPTEINNLRRAHIKDGIAVTKYFYFLKHAFLPDGTLSPWAKEKLRAERLTEITGAALLLRYREEQDGFLEPSFTTISAYGPHAALPHYAPVECSSDAELLPKGLYLVDSGGQYLEGTTDITRTIVMGELTEEMRRHFTMVAIACLRLGAARFPEGATGLTLDYAAREIFWKNGLNYNHGTGHGVGYLLNVHERPNGIRFRVVPERQDSAALVPGNVTSDEPGLYLVGSHGIRTENLTLVEKKEETAFGTFYGFSFLTMVPIDLDGIDVSLMREEDRALLNQYHAEVYAALSPYFEGEELAFLKKATEAV